MFSFTFQNHNLRNIRYRTYYYNFNWFLGIYLLNGRTTPTVPTTYHTKVYSRREFCGSGERKKLIMLS
jgi:hypothetical protein